MRGMIKMAILGVGAAALAGCVPDPGGYYGGGYGAPAGYARPGYGYSYGGPGGYYRPAALEIDYGRGRDDRGRQERDRIERERAEPERRREHDAGSRQNQPQQAGPNRPRPTPERHEDHPDHRRPPNDKDNQRG